MVGCGRVGTAVVTALWGQGYSVSVIDRNPLAFGALASRIASDSRTKLIVGDGTLDKDLSKASAADADLFVALGGSDAGNALSAQIAKNLLQVPTVICRIDDQARNQMYADLGLTTVSAASVLSGMILEATGL